MPVEIIGEFGTPKAPREWMSAQGTLAIRHVVRTCGLPPPEMELEIQWQEHELGAYPMIVLVWEDSMRGAPATYISRCQDALFEFASGEKLPNCRSWQEDEDNDFFASLRGCRQVERFVGGCPRLRLTSGSVGWSFDLG
jgi:hypothetical protein